MKYSIDLSLVTNPSDEIGAYWRGYLLKKAYIDKNRTRVRVSLPKVDAGHIFLLLSDLRSNIVPRKIKRNINGIPYIGIYTNINSKDLIRLLNNLGVDNRHYIRGIFDACGIITNNRNYLRIGCHDTEFLNIIPWKNKSGWWVGNEAVKVLKYLYVDSSRYMESKINKVLKYIIKPT